jgi:capsular exopolysaccharide synthesis family protein
MSIVQSALERLRKDGPQGGKEPRAAPALARDPAVEIRTPAPAQWRADLAAADCTLEKLCAAGLYPSSDFAQRVREEYRGIRRHVITASRERVTPAERPVGPLVMVTSAMPGDGKSFTAVNLALSMAREGVRDVLLIDADTVRHTISTACGLRHRPGLTELLADKSASFRDCSFSTGVPRLYVLPAGNSAGQTTDLFSTARVGPLFESLRTAIGEGFVIIDTPPILMSNDTAVMTDLAGQVLLVVRAGTTMQDLAHEAIARVHEAIPVGLVLNGWSPLLPSERKTYVAYDEYQ